MLRIASQHFIDQLGGSDCGLRPSDVCQLKYVDAAANDPSMRNKVFKARVIGYAMKSGTTVITVKVGKSKICLLNL